MISNKRKCLEKTGFIERGGIREVPDLTVMKFIEARDALLGMDETGRITLTERGRQAFSRLEGEPSAIPSSQALVSFVRQLETSDSTLRAERLQSILSCDDATTTQKRIAQQLLGVGDERPSAHIVSLAAMRSSKPRQR